MYVLKESQQHAVNELFDYYLQYHHQKNDKPIYFQAPTGSGKTLILCSLCNKIMEHSDKCIILFVSISTGDIQEQNYEKAVNYQIANAFDYYPYLISSPSRNNPKAKIDIINYIPLTNHYVYFMGSSTYTKGSMFYTQQTFDSFIKEAKRQGYEIIYIRDEAHIGTSSRKTKDNDTKKLDKLLNDNANLTYYVSATLEQDHDIDVKVADIDAVNDGLIKGNEILYKGVNKNESITSAQLLDTALTEFKKIKKQYIDLGYGINPCLLIQIKNSKKEDKDKEQELIKSYKEAIDKHNLTYVVYTEDNKKESNTRHFNGKGNLTSEEKKLITANDSDIDVVIFKVALATG
ncbi:DEAD/DEAH box helicase family protein [bacterium]|nr:DEAD/DEAH box helicase family protein [bacterium]